MIYAQKQIKILRFFNRQQYYIIHKMRPQTMLRNIKGIYNRFCTI